MPYLKPAAPLSPLHNRRSRFTRGAQRIRRDFYHHIETRLPQVLEGLSRALGDASLKPPFSQLHPI